jgi:hypothetical protein
MAHFICQYFILAAAIAKASQPNVHTVTVGFNNWVFDPETTYADIGDLVVFQFYPTNHSVVRGVYTGSGACGNQGCNPCVPVELIHPGQPGFYSGNVETQAVSTNAYVFSHLAHPKVTNSV